MRRGVSNVGAWVAVAAAVAAMLLLPNAASGDGPTPFPYGELAALGAAEAAPRVRVVAAVDAAVRLRPGLDWPVIGEAAKGEGLAAAGITPGLDPWLRVTLPSGPGGWVRAADMEGVDASAPQVVLRSAPALLAVPAGECAALHAWPGGAATGNLCAYHRSLAVAGRSPDSRWIALSYARWPHEVVWGLADQLDLSASDIAAPDLPVFVGHGTTLVPTGASADGQAAVLPEAVDWAWTPDNQVVGVGERAIWRYDPLERTTETYPRPAGAATLAPDGEHAAVASCSNVWAECGKARQAPFDIVMVPTDGGGWKRVRDAYNLLVGWKFGTPYAVGEWSPDGRALLTWRAPDVPGSEWPGFAVEYSVIEVGGAHYPMPRFGLEPRQYWVWIEDGTLLMRAWRQDAQRHVATLYAATSDGAPLRELELPDTLSGLRWFKTGKGHPWAMLKAAVGSDAGGWRLFDLETGATAPLQISESAAMFAEPSGGRRFAYRIGVDENRALLLFDGTTGAAARLSVPENVGDIGGEFHFAPSGQRLALRGGSRDDVRVYVVEFASGEWIEIDLRIETDEWSPESEDGYVCGGRTNWSPDGEYFTVELREYYERRGEESYRRDGLAGFTSEDVGSQIRIYDRAGNFVRSFRTLGGGSLNSVMEAKWSPDGRWLAVGGRTPSPLECGPGH